MTSPLCTVVPWSLIRHFWPNTTHHCHPIGQDSSGPLKHEDCIHHPSWKSPIQIGWWVDSTLLQSPPNVSSYATLCGHYVLPPSFFGLAWSKPKSFPACVFINNSHMIPPVHVPFNGDALIIIYSFPLSILSFSKTHSVTCLPHLCLHTHLLSVSLEKEKSKLYAYQWVTNWHLPYWPQA